MIEFNTEKTLKEKNFKQISKNIFVKKANFGNSEFVILCPACNRWQINSVKLPKKAFVIVKTCDFCCVDSENTTKIQLEIPSRKPRIVSKTGTNYSSDVAPMGQVWGK